MLLAILERVRGFDAEWKFLRRPSKHCLPNLAPLWANGNFGADGSNVVAAGILKRNVNVSVCFHFCVNDATSKRVPFLLSRHSLVRRVRQFLDCKLQSNSR